MGTFYETLTFVQYDCWVCGVPFALSLGFKDAAVQQRTTFFCPRGCRLSFGKSVADKLRDELERQKKITEQVEAALKFQRQQRESAERSVSALRGQVTKAKKRVGNGTCPCCNRHFAALRRHMQTKHPEYKDGKTVA